MAAEHGKPGGNEDVRVLDDFSCEAICTMDFPKPAALSLGVNADVAVLAELAARGSRTPLTP